jgi:hypothetical protein
VNIFDGPVSTLVMSPAVDDILRGPVFTPGTGTGPTPPPLYVAKAVHTDGTAWLNRGGPLTGIFDSPCGALSIWTNIDGRALGQTDIVCSLPANSLDFFNGNEDTDADFFLQDASGNVFGIEYGTGLNLPPFNGTWAHTLLVWNTNFAAGSRLLAKYVNGTPAITTNFTDNGVAFFPALLTETDWGVMGGGSGDVVPGDYADVQFYPGLNIVQSDSTILPTDLANFIDLSGKPVNPATAAAAYGKPIICLSGDVSTFASNTNGTGGAFVINGTLTNATTHP